MRHCRGCARLVPAGELLYDLCERCWAENDAIDEHERGEHEQPQASCRLCRDEFPDLRVRQVGAAR